MCTPLEVIEEGETVYRCNRVREAWSMGTMSEDDFEEVISTNPLDLLQALHDELEGKKKKYATGEDDYCMGAWEAIKDQQDNLQALMDKIRV